MSLYIPSLKKLCMCNSSKTAVATTIWVTKYGLKKLSNILGNLDTINDSYKYSQVILQTRLHELFETFYYVIKLNVNISKILFLVIINFFVGIKDF